jgi:hypothetical protein
VKAPARVKVGWAHWQRIARAIGNFQARVLLTIFYFVLIPPFALLVKWLGDPLRLTARHDGTYWVTRPLSDESEAARRRQY